MARGVNGDDGFGAVEQQSEMIKEVFRRRFKARAERFILERQFGEGCANGGGEDMGVG